MKDRCIQAVSDAIGRPITKAESVKIEERLLKTMRQAAQQDPDAFRDMSSAERLKMGAELAAKELIAEAELKKRRIELTIEAHDRLQNYVEGMVAKGMDRLDALKRTLVFVPDGKSETLSAESRGNAIRSNAIRQLVDTFEAVDPRFWGLMESQEGIQVLTKAIFGEKVDLPQAQKGAEAWLKLAEELKSQFNQAGGKIGTLDNWSLPQHHSELKVNKAGREKWINDVFPKLNRDKYVGDDGRRMSDEGVMSVLSEAWWSISTGGVNQMQPGAPGNGMLANRRAAHREIHFKDADSYLEYQKQYGEKSLWGVITNHVEGLAKEIAALETYGPNPDRTFQLMLEKQYQNKVLAEPSKKGKFERQAKKLQGLYDYTTGKTAPIVNEHLAKGFDTLRNWLVSSRLGSAAVTAIADEATIHLTANVNRLPQMQLFANELAAFNIANTTEKNLAHRAGLAVDTMIGHLNRWGQDNLGPTFSSKMSSTVMRMSGLEALDGARRRAFGVTYMSALGEMTRKYGTLKNIDANDYKILLSKGITETDWAIWKQAELESWGAGNGVLTPESIMRVEGVDVGAKREAVLRLLGVVLEETDMAVIRPGAQEKYFSGGGMERGTWKGELTRSFFLFKSFPIAMIYRHWMRGLNQETAGGKAMYLASLIAGTTVLGAVAQTVNDLVSGKDPRNYINGEHVGKNWMAAFLKGGSLGLYGDFLFSQSTQGSRTGPLGAMMGPVAGLVEETFNLTQGNLIQAAQGKDTHFGAEAVRFVKGNLPGANLWYAKAGLDHLIFNQLQEYFSPGYLGKVRSRAQKEFGQQFWWDPNGGARAPNVGRAFGTQ